MPTILETDVGEIELPDDFTTEQIQDFASTKLPRLREDLKLGVLQEKPARSLRDIGSAGWETVKGLVRGRQLMRDAAVTTNLRQLGVQAAMTAPPEEEPEIFKAADDVAKRAEKRLADTREQRLQENPIYRTAEEQQKEGVEFYRVNPALEETIPSQLIRAGSTTLPILAAGVTGPAAPFVGAALYGAMSGQQGAEEAIETGHPDKADEAYLAYAGLGAISEAALGYPIALLRSIQAARRAGVDPKEFGRAFRTTLAEKGKQISQEILKASGREAVQESTEQAGQNVAARMIGYDPERPLTKNVWEAFWIGGAVGGLFGGVAGTARTIDESPRNKMVQLLEQGLDLRPIEQQAPGLADIQARAGMAPEAAQRTVVPAMLAPQSVAIALPEPEPPPAQEPAPEPIRRRSPFAPIPTPESPRFMPPGIRPVPTAPPVQPATATTVTAPVIYRGAMEGAGGAKLHLYDLTADIPGHPKGSTVSEPTLRNAGLAIPEGMPSSQTSAAPQATIERLPDGIRLAGLQVPESERGKGVGTQLVQDLITESEETRKPIYLTASTSADQQARLNAFYERLGFEQWRTDPLSGKPMYRYIPKSLTASLPTQEVPSAETVRTSPRLLPQAGPQPQGVQTPSGGVVEQKPPEQPKPVATREEAPQAPGQVKWYDQLAPDTRETVFAEMRRIQGVVDSYAEEERKMRPPQGTIAVGAAAFDPFLRSEALATVLRGLRNGLAPQAAGAEAKAFAREAVAKHNRKRPKDINWARDEGTADTVIDDAVRRVLSLSAAPTAPSAATPTPTPAPVATPAMVQQEAQAQVAQTAAVQGQRAAKEVKSELVQRLEEASANAPSASEVAAKTYTKANMERVTEPAQDHGRITIEIPGDGTFTIVNTKEAIESVLKKARKIDTAPTAKKVKALNIPEMTVTEWNIEFGTDSVGAVALKKAQVRPTRSGIQTQLDQSQPPPQIKELHGLQSPEDAARINRAKAAVVAKLGSRYGTRALRQVSPDLSDQSTAVQLGLDDSSRRAIMAAFRHDIIFFDSEYPINGLILSDQPGVIFLNIRSRRLLPTVIFHELMEHLRLSMPEDYLRFRSVLLSEMQNVEEYARVSGLAESGATANEIIDEMIADFAAYESQNPYFWHRMSERLGQSTWQRIGNAILRFLKGVLDSIRGFETTRFFKDVDRVRNELADVMAKFAQQSGSPVTRGGPAEAFFQLEDVFKSAENLERFIEKETISPEVSIQLRDQAGAQAALVPDSIADEIKALNPEDAIEKRIAALLDFVTKIHGLSVAIDLRRILNSDLHSEDLKQAAIGGVLRQVQRVEVNAKEINDNLQDSLKTLATLMKGRGRIEKEHLIEERSKQITQNLVAGYKSYLTAQAATLPADQNVAAARQQLLNRMDGALNEITKLPSATMRALEAIAERINEVPVTEGPQSVIDAIRTKDILRGKVGDSTISMLTEEKPGGLPPLLLNPAINDLLRSLSALQQKAATYAKQIEVVEKAFQGKAPGDPGSTTRFEGEATPVQLRKWADTYRKFRNQQADAARALAEYDESFRKADEDIQVYGRSKDVLDRLQSSPEYQEQMRLALGRPGGEIRRDLYQSGKERATDPTKETVYVSPLKYVDEEGKETQNTFRVHLAPNIQADKAAIEQMASLVEEIERFLAGENGPVDPILERTWRERRDYIKQYVLHPKFLQEDAGGTWANPFNWGRFIFGGLSSSLRGELEAIGLRAADEADREVRTAEKATIGYRILANNKEFGDAATTVATINAVKSHNWDTSRIRYWNQYVLNPIIAAGQTAGQMRLKAGDYIPGTDIQITREDMIVAGMEKRFSQGIVQTTQGTARGLPSLLRNNPVLIEDTFSGKPVLRGAMSPGPLTMARSFSTWGRQFDLNWHNSTTPEARRRLVQDGDNFQMAVLGYIRTTNPEFENTSPLLKLYEAFAKNAKDDVTYKVNSMDQLLDKLAEIAVKQGLFENKADAIPQIEATLMAEIGQHAAAIRNQFAEEHPTSEDVPQEVMQFASSQSAFTKPRKRMVAPDSYYDYTLTHESDRISFVAAALQQFQLRIITAMEALQTALGIQQSTLDAEINDLYSRGMSEKKARKTVDKRTAQQLGSLRFSYTQLLEHKRRLDKMVKQMKELVIDVRNPNDSPLIAALTRGHSLLSSGLLANPTAIGNNLAGGILSAKNVTLRNLGQARSFWNVKAHTRLVPETIKKLLRAVHGTTPIGKLARSNLPIVKDMAGWVNDMLLEQIQREADAESFGLISRTDMANRMRARGELMATAGQIDYESPKGVAAAINAAGSLPGVRHTLGQLRDKIPGAFDRFMNTNNARFYQDTLFLTLKTRAIQAFKAREAMAARTGQNLDELNDFSQEANLLTPKEMDLPKASGFRDAGRLRQLFSTVGSLDAFLLDYYNRWKAAPEGEKAAVPLFPEPADEGAIIHDIEAHENIATAGFTPLAFQGVGQRGLLKKMLFLFRNYPTRMFTQMARMLATDPRDPKVRRELHNWWGVLVLLIVSALAGLIGKEVATPIQQALTGRNPSFVKLSNVLENPDAGMLARYVGVGLASNLPYYGGVISQILGNPGYGTWLDAAEYIPAAGLVKDAGLAIRRTAQTGDPIFPAVDFIARWFPPASPALRLIPDVAGDIEGRNAARALRVVGPSAGMELAGGAGATYKQTPATLETRRLLAAAYRGDTDGIREAFDAAVAARAAAGSSDPEKAVLASLAAATPARRVFGRSITQGEEAQLLGLMSSGGRADYAKSRDAFALINQTLGTRYSLTSVPRARRITGGRRRRSLFAGSSRSRLPRIRRASSRRSPFAQMRIRRAAIRRKRRSPARFSLAA